MFSATAAGDTDGGLFVSTTRSYLRSYLVQTATYSGGSKSESFGGSTAFFRRTWQWLRSTQVLRMEDYVEETNTSLEGSDDLIWKPKYGMEFDSEQVAYDFYNGYGQRQGFSIRRDGCRKNKLNELTSRTFVCCKEGLRKKDKRDDLTKTPRADTRTGCNAHMGIKLARHTGSQAAEVELAADSGISVKSAFELMGRQAGGRESLGYTKQDQKNYLRTIRQRKMEYGEASYVLNYFSKQMLENPSFFYEMQLDSEEQLQLDSEEHQIIRKTKCIALETY